MTFGPGSTYGDGGHSAATAYYFLTWIGIAVTVISLVAWMIFEHRQLISHAIRLSGNGPTAPPGA
jgi:hypothetical protein